ncbi:MAG: hypothetical protein V4611_03245 [Patescibacteria group bacterium]
MPVVNVLATPLWLPSIDFNGRIDGETWNGSSETRRQYDAMKELLSSSIVQLVANTINEVDDVQLGDQEVMVIPQQFHPWALNTPDIWFDIQPGARLLMSDRDQRERRRKIIEFVSAGLVEFFFSKSLNPRFDVECRPLSGTGYSIVDFERVHSWGLPSY